MRSRKSKRLVLGSMSAPLSAHLSVSVNAAPTCQISMKFDKADIYENLPRVRKLAQNEVKMANTIHKDKYITGLYQGVRIADMV